jgi:hypothetical protein
MPTKTEIKEQNEYLLKRQRDFQLAAEYVAEALAAFPEVARVALFGSVSRPLVKEIPRFRAYRRAGIEVFHECKDVDLAVWVSDLGCLRALGKARGQALNRLLQEKDVGVAHHQVDVFIIEPGSNSYLGRLCCYGICPKGKPECRVPDCGNRPFLQQHEDFTFYPDALKPDKINILFERNIDPSIVQQPLHN